MATLRETDLDTELSGGGGGGGGEAAFIGEATVDVSTLATGGTGTWADPWTGWQAPMLAATGPNMTILFPTGVYAHSTTLELGKYFNIHYLGSLGTVLKYTGGAARAVSFLAPTTSYPGLGIGQRVFGNTFENFIIDGGGNATDGLYVEETHNSVFRNIYVRNVTNARFYFNWTISLPSQSNVLNVFPSP